MKQAKSYTVAHLDDEGDYHFEFLLPEYNLLRIKLKSRHLSNTKYNCYIQFDPKKNAKNKIKAWYCTCKAGKYSYLTKIIKLNL
jgi:hypothetical protein